MLVERNASALHLLYYEVEQYRASCSKSRILHIAIKSA